MAKRTKKQENTTPSVETADIIVPSDTNVTESSQQEMETVENLTVDSKEVAEQIIVQSPVEVEKPQELSSKEEVINPTPEPVVNTTSVALRKLGKISVSGEFLRSTTNFFTALHRQGYVILSRENNEKLDSMTFLLEGGIFDPIPEGTIVPMYNFSFGNRLIITKR